LPSPLQPESAALAAQPDIGMLLACNVIVREQADGGQTVGLHGPDGVMQMIDDPEVSKVPPESGRFECVRVALTASASA